MKYDYDCVVIGAGIAGMTSAIFLKRYNLNVLLLDKGEPGGLLNKISVIENYPGFTNIKGVDLAQQIYGQVKENKIEFKHVNVLKIDGHKVLTDIEEITTNKIIIATGRKPRKIKENIQYQNLRYNAVDNVDVYKDKVVAVVGGGNSALEESIFLSKYCKEVIIINRSNKLRADEVVKSQIENISNINLILECSISNINAENDIIYSIETNKGIFNIDFLFSFIGYEPSISFLDNLEMDNNYVVVDKNMKTNIDNIYACGDIIKKDLYLLTTAVGEASLAALNVKKDIIEENR